MAKGLIIVESPAKIKTIKKFLGSDYLYESSVGHIRDLPEKGFGIDIENDFEPQYETLPQKDQVVKNLIKAAKLVDVVYLAPDPDREGEAIAWHIAEILPKGTVVKRTAFHSITKKEVERALANPEEINLALVDAQQARRLLDRIVGYKISPILARRVLGGRREGASVSAGRVQSVALKLVVDRELEIEKFNPVEYWTLTAEFNKDGEKTLIHAHLHSVDGKRVEKEAAEGKDLFLVPDGKTAAGLKAQIESGDFSLTRVEKKEKKRNPVAPFITSTLQQEASRYFGFSASRTMSVAQGLYEGIDLGQDGTEGLITYMRTDSVRCAPEAIAAARDLIGKVYGKDYLPKSARLYATKKSAQDAHEGIRPADLKYSPDSVKQYLSREQHQLYSLIWKRFIASQMESAVYDTISGDISDGKELILRTTGSTLKFNGFLAVYEEKVDEEKQDEAARQLPDLTEGEHLNLQKAESEQSFTKPPPRFSEASLIKELEKSGIGRPSTFTSIMGKIQGRQYTVKEKGRLVPTELGRVCAALLETSFPKIMNAAFTSEMEDILEEVAEAKKEWKSVIRDFWADFLPTLEKAEKEAHVPRVETDEPCPKCGKNLQKIWARSQYFYGCSGYPDCDFTAKIEELTFDKGEFHADFDWEQACPQCEGEMKVRHGRFGAFLGCLKYPDCKGTVHIPRKNEELLDATEMPKCPANECPGQMVARRSRFGKIFYSCSTYPDCDVIVNDLDDLPTKYVDHERTPYVKKTRKKGATAAAKKKKATKTKKKATTKKKPTTRKPMPPSKLSPELAELVGASEMSRGDVMKALWAYIKEHKLQDPKDGRIIVPDEKLTKFFGSSEPVHMLKLTGIVSGHLLK